MLLGEEEEVQATRTEDAEKKAEAMLKKLNKLHAPKAAKKGRS